MRADGAIGWVFIYISRPFEILAPDLRDIPMAIDQLHVNAIRVLNSLHRVQSQTIIVFMSR